MKIVDQDAYDKAQILLHKAFGGDVSRGNADFIIGDPVWNFECNDYRIVGPSRTQFDPIQHMKDGGALLFGNGVAFKYIGVVLHYKFSSQPESNWRDASKEDAAKLLRTLVFKSDDDEFPKQYQEPEKPVVWKHKKRNVWVKIQDKKVMVKMGRNSTDWSETRSPELRLIEIAQGKWERVDD